MATQPQTLEVENKTEDSFIMPTIVPVFCTADVPTKTLDIFLTRSKEYSQRADWVPRIITLADLNSPESINGPSEVPVAPFASPFVDMEITEIVKIFQECFAPLDAFSNRLFAVLDKRTVEEDIESASCLVVFGDNQFHKDDKDSFMRTDFYYSMKLLGCAELGVLNLDEETVRNEVLGVHNVIGME